MKWKIVLFSSTTVRSIQEKSFENLTSKAALIQERFAGEDQVMDIDRLNDD